ncbi:MULTISPECIES: TonB-dependent receptor [unclassified Pseudoalteromonas]|uniref:TonB-dependent receptor domain-containing protein n=1 Tax=unclassified Pseudoalteromonas TaxID=194690 RepID=UPI002097F703|nr:TonB-dependent receptor [Pseudoalteromonas sp. XMcav2-N]MCO7188098.1 TonB-dependent receptor [Pseudoalteromonas sp. XMcav2-N]
MHNRTSLPFIPTVLAAVLSCVGLPAMANETNMLPQTVEFRLPAGKLGDVLNIYSRQARVTLSFEEQLVEGVTVPAISGQFDSQTMLLTLLSNTNLQAIPVGAGAWVIQPKSTEGVVTLDTIQVETRSDSAKAKTYQTSASVNVVTKENIERFRGTSVGDVFQGIPGVLVSENRNSGGLDINIRGMQGQGRVPVVIDGSRQETTVYRGYSGVSSRSYIDPDLIGNMQINKGPTMSASGTGATGGVVNVKTLRAEDIVAEGKLSGYRVRLSGIGNSTEAPEPGTYAGYYLPRNAYRSDCRFSEYCEEKYLMPERFAPEEGMDRPSLFDFSSYAMSLAGAQRFEWGDVLMAYAHRKQGNYYAGTNGPAPSLHYSEPQKQAWYTETEVAMEGVSRFRASERIPNTNFASTSWLLSTTLVLPHDQSLELSYIRYDSEYGEMMPSQIQSFGHARQWLNSEVLNQTYTISYGWQPVELDGIDLEANLWHTDTVTDLNTPGVGSIELESNTARTDAYQRWGADVSNTMRFYPKGELKWSYGIAGQWEDMDTDTPTDSGFYAGSRSGWRDEYSAFTNVLWQPWQAWTFEAGLRYTRFTSKDNNPLPLSTDDPACVSDGTGGCEAVYYRNEHSGGAPVFAVTWGFAKHTQLYVRHAKALRMPSLFENTSGWSVSPTLDVAVKPERALNRELGINYFNESAFKWGHQVGAKLAVFNNHVDDYLTRTRANAWEQSQGLQGYFRLRNIDSLTLNGMEANLSYDARTWLVELNGTHYSKIEVCNVASYVRYYCNDWGLPESYVNNMIPPNWHASLNLGLRLMGEKLELGLRGTLMGKRNSVPANNANPGFIKPVEWHSYRLIDFYSRYKFNDMVAVDLTIDNITDRYYLDALSLGLVPAPGRTAKLSLTLEF